MHYSDICAMYKLQINNYFYAYYFKGHAFPYQWHYAVTHYHSMPLMFKNEFKVCD